MNSIDKNFDFTSIAVKIKESPCSSDLYFQLGRILLKHNKTQQAFQSFNKGLEYSRNCKDGSLECAGLMAEAGALVESSELYRNALACSPSDSQAYRRLGEVLQALGESGEAAALEAIAQSIEQSHQPILAAHQLETYITLCDSLARQGRFDCALKIGKLALNIAPESIEIRSRLEKLKSQSISSKDISRELKLSTSYQLTETECNEYLQSFHQDGFVLIPNYYSREYCQYLRQKLEKIVTTTHTNVNFLEGAYLRHQKLRRVSADAGVSRIYHLERLLPELEAHKFDPIVARLVSSYSGRPMYSKNLWYQYNQVSKETRYFHVDMFALRSQIKSILYLQDTGLENGPFCYIQGSHRNTDLIRSKFYSTNPPGQNSGYTPEEVEPFADAIIPVEAKAGSLILADVGGAHRGLPQKLGSRSILMQYFMDTPGDIEDEKE
ncbi:MAG: phytanoyl-CoA dioxygenase family protein [Cyanobacteria bacterium SID2]|nr:phytanoyl-CoA dioxygenase family protein [Cyanobacteria bacterium SID2]